MSTANNNLDCFKTKGGGGEGRKFSNKEKKNLIQLIILL
jgi:hypothetical protein